MFGGAGIYRDGLMFALAAGGEIYLKTDGETAAQFRDAGSRPFVFAKAGTLVATSYWSLPEAALDDGDVLRVWAERAYGSAQRVRKPKSAKAAPRGLP